jgi:hypothetical protein
MISITTVGSYQFVEERASRGKTLLVLGAMSAIMWGGIIFALVKLAH